MFTQAGFTNVNTVTIDFFAAAYNGFRSATWRYEFEGDADPKQGDSGQHDSHAFVRRLIIDIEGQIKGSSETDYWTKRDALIAALLVDRGAQTAYKHGTFTLTPTGKPQMYADVVVTALAFPRAFDEPLMSRYQASFRCDYGYWRAVSGGAVVKR